MSNDALIKGVASAISQTKAELEGQIASVRRDVKNDLTSLLARDWSGDLVKDWREQRSYRPGDLVRHKGGIWQAWADTDGKPGADQAGWVCLANAVADVKFEATDLRERKLTVELADGQTKEFAFSEPTLIYKGVWQESQEYDFNHIVICGGDAYISLEADNSTKPATDGTKWGMFVQRGKTGKPGIQGERGEKGDKGEDANPLTVARIVERNIASALDELAETGEIAESEVAPIIRAVDRISRERIEEVKNIFNVAEPSDDRIPLFSRGLYVQGAEYRRGDMVSITALGIYVALATTRQDPRTNHPDWQTFAVFPHAMGGTSSAPTPVPTETVTNLVYDPLTRTISYTNEVGTVQTFVSSQTNTTIVFDSVSNILTYTDENGAAFTADISAMAANVYVSGATYDTATKIITFTDASAATPDVTVDLSAFSASLVANVDGTYTHTAAGVTTLIDFRRSFATVPSTRNYDGRVIELNGLIYKYLATPGTYVQIS